MKNLTSLFLSVFLIFLSTELYSQEKNVKWGKLTGEEIAYKRCYFDTLASAVVLSDIGMISIRYSQIPITMDRHVRIKILNEQGLDRTNIELPYYSKDGTEKITSVKAQTLKIIGDKVVKVPVPKEEIYDVRVDDKYSVIRFAFPSVEPGDVIEYQYTLFDENVLLPEGWEFQTDIPTLYSEYNAMVQEGWDIRIFYASDLLIKKYGTANARKWILENMPAIREESWCPCPADYTNKLTFQLAGYLTSKPMGGTEYKTIAMNWDELASAFLTSSEYLDFLAPDKSVEELGLRFASLPEEERIREIYHYVNSNWRWNKYYRSFPEQRLSRFLQARAGNSSEINLLLVNLLRAAGQTADPVLISTKTNGIIRKEYPLIRQFNHVIAGIRRDDKIIFLDATDPNRSMDILDDEDYCKEGFRIIKNASSWVTLPDPPVSSYMCLSNIDLQDQENPKVEVQVKVNNHEAARLRNKLTDIKDYGKFVEDELLNGERGLELSDSVKVRNLDDPDSDLIFEFSLLPSGLLEQMNDILTLHPFNMGLVTESPLKPDNRVLPVDFIYKRRFQQITNIILPENSVILNIPKTDKMIMKGDRMKFNYLVITLDGKIQLVHDLQINDTVFMPFEIRYMLEVFNSAINRQAEPVLIGEKSSSMP
ncbi:MAG: DUF3857 and transglutaminase domain-containing protein [Bacteroidota bacterium]